MRVFHENMFPKPVYSQPFCSTASNGIVIATERKSSSILIDDAVIEKVAVICPNIGIVYSGMGPDFRVLVTRARKSAQAYWKIHGEYPPTKILTQEIANIMQQATHSGCVIWMAKRLALFSWARQRCPAVRRVPIGRRLGRQPGTHVIPG